MNLPRRSGIEICIHEDEVKEAFRSAGESIVSRKQFDDLVKLSTDDIVSCLQNSGYTVRICQNGEFADLYISWGDDN